MCLSTAYSNVRDPETVMAKNVTQITFDGDDIMLVDLMDNEIRVPGKLKMVDLINAYVIIDTSADSSEEVA
jgi:predicted RNA-binding protein